MAGAAGLILAAPASGSGKTVVTLGLLRRLRARGVAIASGKLGPDYIDPRFHEAASGAPCRNLDTWAMRPETLARDLAALGPLVLCEGAMGLFDGAGPGGARGSTAELAALLGWPIILVVDASGQGASVAALAGGFARHRDDVAVAGIVLNRVASARHEAVLRAALASHHPGIPVLGAVPRDAALALPSRHLGLVQAEEHPALERFLEGAAAIVGDAVDLDRLIALARPAVLPAPAATASRIEPPGSRIAVARDAAFAFHYPALLDDWRRAGAALFFFAPLADETPEPQCDAVYLPGGYPELHAGRLAAAGRFLGGLRAAAARGAAIWGECGGYMVLGTRLVDRAGAGHDMAGLLPVETSFATPRLHLGYRRLRLLADAPFGAAGESFAGHEFHYSAALREGPAAPLFAAEDADGAALGTAGLIRGRIAGAYIHMIDRVARTAA